MNVEIENQQKNRDINNNLSYETKVYESWYDVGDNKKKEDEITNEISTIKRELQELRNEIVTLKNSNIELRNEISEMRGLNEREKNLNVRSGVPFRFTPEYNRYDRLIQFGNPLRKFI